MAENPRTTTARDNDDHELIEGMVADADTGVSGSTSGGQLAQDVGSQNDLVREVGDPDALTRPQRSDDIHHDQARPHAKPNDAGRTG